MSFFSKGTGRVNSSFERRSRPGGGSSRSYSEQVSAPAHMRAEKRRLLLLLLITVVLPPVGVACLWRGGFLRIPYRVAATALAFVLMILYFHWMIPEKTPETYQPGIMKPSAVTEYSPSSLGASEDNGSGGN